MRVSLSVRARLPPHCNTSIISRRYVWPDPVAGSCMDVFELSEDGQVLTVNSTYKREATQKVIKHKQVFNKVK